MPSGVTVAAGSSVVVTPSVSVEVVPCSPDGVVWGRCCGVAFGGAGAGEAVVEGVGVAAAGEPPGTGATGGARGPVSGSGCGVARSCWSDVTRVSGVRDVSGFLETSAEFSVSSAASSASGVLVSSSAVRWRSGVDRVSGVPGVSGVLETSRVPPVPPVLSVSPVVRGLGVSAVSVSSASGVVVSSSAGCRRSVPSDTEVLPPVWVDGSPGAEEPTVDGMFPGPLFVPVAPSAPGPVATGGLRVEKTVSVSRFTGVGGRSRPRAESGTVVSRSSAAKSS
ncbi:hypothetical protein APS67_005798 [Streptomyces sp. AVP053U2]|nr:hypothetical protein APS67_005798 [Streptomyces sp. AVP053U2]